MVWLWVAVWVALVLLAAGVLALIGRSVWHEARALMRDAGEAAERLSVLSDRLQEAAEQNPEPQVAVFDSPTRLRQERFTAARARGPGQETRLVGLVRPIPRGRS